MAHPLHTPVAHTRCTHPPRTRHAPATHPPRTRHAPATPVAHFTHATFVAHFWLTCISHSSRAQSVPTPRFRLSLAKRRERRQQEEDDGYIPEWVRLGWHDPFHHRGSAFDRGNSSGSNTNRSSGRNTSRQNTSRQNTSRQNSHRMSTGRRSSSQRGDGRGHETNRSIASSIEPPSTPSGPRVIA